MVNGARLDPARIAFGAAVLVLAAQPAAWLVGTWGDAAFASYGFAFFAVAAALFAWSFSSPFVRAADRSAERRATLMLAFTACVRLAGQTLAIDTISAFALVIDVYALAHLAGLDRRARPVAPFWLAAAFAFALPLERIAQRIVGYPLQELSAKGACAILSALFGDVTCAGVRISVRGADVMVDLPCSGARALLIFLFFFATLAALVRPRPALAAAGALLSLAAAALGNLARIALLAGGVALGPRTLGFDVMQEPWHNLAGLAALGLVAPIVLVWARLALNGEKPGPRSSRGCEQLGAPASSRPERRHLAGKNSDACSSFAGWKPAFRPARCRRSYARLFFHNLSRRAWLNRDTTARLRSARARIGLLRSKSGKPDFEARGPAPRLRMAASLGFLLSAVAIVLAPRTPVDVAVGDIAVAAPERIGAHRAQPLALAPRERGYFEQYGGAAAKAAYGQFALLLVRTNAPLRHLHAPDACLSGLGFKVAYLGLRFEPIPTALHRAEAPDGRVYRVETSYVSDRGRAAASVAEAVWIWLSDRSSVWTAIERVTPEGADARERAAFENAVIAALDAPQTENAPIPDGMRNSLPRASGGGLGWGKAEKTLKHGACRGDPCGRPSETPAFQGDHPPPPRLWRAGKGRPYSSGVSAFYSVVPHPNPPPLARRREPVCVYGVCNPGRCAAAPRGSRHTSRRRRRENSTIRGRHAALKSCRPT